MSVSTLIVAVRTAGAAALVRVGAGFTALGARARAAGAAMRSAASPRIAAGLARIAAAATLAAAGFSRLAHAARDAAASLGTKLLALAPMVAKWVAIGGAIFAVAVPLIPAVANLAGLMQLIAPAALAGAVSLVTLKVALSGVGDAIKAGLAGTSKEDVEKFNEALKKLTPSAREFARSAVDIAKAWRPVKAAIQESFFATGNLAHEIRQLSIEFKPLAQKWLPQIAGLFSKLFKSASDFLTLGSTRNDIEAIMRNTFLTISAGIRVVKALGRALFDVLYVASPRLADMADNAAIAADRFAGWVHQLRESGKLGGWLDKGRETLGQLIEIGKELGRVFAAIFKGGEEKSKPFLQAIRDSLAELADWLESDNGQEFIKGMGDMAIAIAKVGTAISGWSEDFSKTREDLHSWGDTVKEVFLGLLTPIQIWANVALSAMAAVLHGAAASAEALGMKGLADKLRGAAKAVEGFRDDVNRALAGIHDKTINVDINYRSRGERLPAAVGSTIGSGNIRALASGGPVRAGETAWVGEQGPELVTFSRSGRVHPAGSAGMGGALQLVAAGGPNSSTNWLVGAVNEAINRGQLKLRVRAGSNQVMAV